jgi:uncharacterized protein (DUF2062 family)
MKTASDHYIKRLWNRFIIKPIKHQLTRGMTVEKVALSMAIAPIVALFPILGSTTLLGIITAAVLKLNQPFLLFFKSLFYPLHLAMILIYIRLGETLNNAEHITFSIPELLTQFMADPLLFFKKFGMTALYGIEAWALTTPALAIILYYLFRYLLKRYIKILPSEKNYALNQEDCQP